MKFSISFKYSNVTFKNKETKETISYETKAEGNTFTFDNVDEDIVLGIVKGIKDKKASLVFSYDDFRTNFINVMARNKCKELYDKLDKGEWKIGDIAISNITIKDLEFTKPTMNARETLTVESKKVVKESEDVFDPEEIAKDVTDVFAGQMGWTRFPTAKFIDWLRGTYAFKIMSREDSEYAARKYLEREVDGYIADFMTEKLGFEGNETAEEMSEYFNESKARMNEDFKDTIHKQNQDDLSEIVNAVNKAIKDIDLITFKIEDDKICERLFNVRENLLNALPSTKTSKKMGWNESKETVEVDFKKTPDDGTVIAFFPQTMHDGSCNPGMIMSYEHNGQHGEASIDYYKDCTTCLEEDYISLLHELEGIYDDCELVIV